jgi:hypothetical protein
MARGDQKIFLITFSVFLRVHPHPSIQHSTKPRLSCGGLEKQTLCEAAKNLGKDHQMLFLCGSARSLPEAEKPAISAQFCRPALPGCGSTEQCPVHYI